MATRRRNPKNKTKKNKRIRRKRGGGGKCRKQVIIGRSASGPSYGECGGDLIVDVISGGCTCNRCGAYSDC